ncbi:MAG: alpha-1,4-glucan--maltose-1-phosphate maltosyltransferase, partial [Elusimicrobia bacterium CG08_land_8_20_14_0_20_59_10]
MARKAGKNVKPAEAPEKVNEPAVARVVIESVSPEIDGGRFPVKRVTGELVRVEADIFADGHDELVCFLLHRREGARAWKRVPMTALGNDRWSSEFAVTRPGSCRYTVEGRIDPFRTWLRDLQKRLAAGQDLRAEFAAGAGLISEAAQRAAGADARRLKQLAQEIVSGGDQREKAARLSDPELAGLVSRWGDDTGLVRYGRELEVTVDRLKARFSAWYELFPRSTSPKPGRHGNFKDLIARLPYIAEMGFDVLYLPPIHPVGTTSRKGRNNTLTAKPGDPGSPWAIGDRTGGHKAINPELGTLEDFKELMTAAGKHGLEVALDIAFQCSPDHPWLKEHPEWFRHRPDGSLRCAENPPKKYEDIYPMDFACRDWKPLWEEVKSVFEFWAERGVRIFRVDNPHTKPFALWEWLIRELRR